MAMGRVAGIEVRLIDYTRDCARLSAAAAVMSINGKPLEEVMNKIDQNNIEKWVKVIVTHGYTSVLEHCKYTFEVVCSRVCSHQLVRHRIASYTQLSMRRSEEFLIRAAVKACELTGYNCAHPPRTKEDYGNYGRVLYSLVEDIEFDAWSYRIAKEAVKEAFIIPPGIDGHNMYHLVEALTLALANYWWLRYMGYSPDDARYVVPDSVKTRIVVTMNARELLEVFLPLRLCRRAHWEIREVARQVLLELRRVEPTLWRWAGPRCLRVAQLAGAECTLDDLLEGRCRLPIEKCPEGVKRDKAIPCMLETAKWILGKD